MPTLGRVIDLPVRETADLVSSAVANAASATRRVTDEPGGVVDDWGRDPALVRRIMTLCDLRWDITIGGDQHLPRRAGALIVVNARRSALTSLFSAFAISRATDRPVRFVGRDDTTPVGALARRLGGLIDHPVEVFGALRAGELVVMSTTATRSSREVGRIDHTLVGAAVAASTRVHPAAAMSSPLVRDARIEIGPASRPPHKRRGPLVELELADRVGDEIGRLLEEMAGLDRRTPFDWLPFIGMGSD